MAKTKGAVQFGVISLEQLNNVLKPAADVLVSIKFAKMIGLGALIRPVVLDKDNVVAVAATQEDVVSVETFGAARKGKSAKAAKKTKTSESSDSDDEGGDIEIGVTRF